MFAVTGITGQVGSAVAQNLLQQGHKVRALVRDPEKARQWEAKGCERVRWQFITLCVALLALENDAGTRAEKLLSSLQ